MQTVSVNICVRIMCWKHMLVRITCTKVVINQNKRENLALLWVQCSIIHRRITRKSLIGLWISDWAGSCIQYSAQKAVIHQLWCHKSMEIVFARVTHGHDCRNYHHSGVRWSKAQQISLDWIITPVDWSSWEIEPKVQVHLGTAIVNWSFQFHPIGHHHGQHGCIRCQKEPEIF